MGSWGVEGGRKVASRGMGKCEKIQAEGMMIGSSSLQCTPCLLLAFSADCWHVYLCSTSDQRSSATCIPWDRVTTGRRHKEPSETYLLLSAPSSFTSCHILAACLCLSFSHLTNSHSHTCTYWPDWYVLIQCQFSFTPPSLLPRTGMNAPTFIILSFLWEDLQVHKRSGANWQPWTEYYHYLSQNITVTVYRTLLLLFTEYYYQYSQNIKGQLQLWGAEYLLKPVLKYCGINLCSMTVHCTYITCTYSALTAFVCQCPAKL